VLRRFGGQTVTDISQHCTYIPNETAVTVYQPHSRFKINLGALQNTF
jgi:hypothetical protein